MRNDYFRPALVFSLLFCLMYFVVNNHSPHLHRVITLSIGLLNGLAMGLLFGRFISMEHALQNVHFIDDKTVFTFNNESNKENYNLPYYFSGKTKHQLKKN